MNTWTMEGKLFEDFGHIIILLMLGSSSVIVCVLSEAPCPTSKGEKDRNGTGRETEKEIWSP